MDVPGKVTVNGPTGRARSAAGRRFGRMSVMRPFG